MKKKHVLQTETPCPCGSNKTYADCCMLWHQGEQHLQAPDAKTLMRSRYTAYVFNLHSYLLETWHPETRPASLEETDPPPKWISLQIHNSNPKEKNHATVEFTAKYTVNGKANRMHEISTFEKIDDRWYYKNGVLT